MDIVSVIQQKNRDEHIVEMQHLDLEEHKLLLEECRLAIEEKKNLHSHPSLQPVPLQSQMQFETLDPAMIDQLALSAPSTDF